MDTTGQAHEQGEKPSGFHLFQLKGTNAIVCELVQFDFNGKGLITAFVNGRYS